MDIKLAAWQQNVIENLELKGLIARPVRSGTALLLNFENAESIVIHLISLADHPALEETLQLQSSIRNDGKQLIQLWEDIWFSRPLQVLSRIGSLLGKNKTVHGRKTKISTLTQTEAALFFDQYHLQSSAAARYKYALTLNGEIVAAASFSAKRKMTRKAEGYTSVELIRFASKEGITVQGGLSKLIRHLTKTLSPSDIMTYTDLDWSDGQGYTRLGFELVETSAPAEIWVHTKTMTRVFPHRLPPEIREATALMSAEERVSYLKSLDYILIFNTGNHKYILTL